MNLFLLGTSAAGAADAARAAAVLEALREPFFGPEPVQTWSAPAGRAAGAWLAHAPDRVGGVRYAAQEGGRLALFSGRPIRWSDDGVGAPMADGRGPLDPATYLDGPLAAVTEGLDGRFVVARAGDDGVEVVTDALGAYPVFRSGGWVSNSPEALRLMCGGGELSPDALAGVLGGGWSLSGDPLWSAITRVPWRGARRRAPGKGFDAGRAARLLVAAVRALADWPGRPNVVLVTGGRDSRLILAAALRAGIEMEVRTGGTEDMPDVIIGRRLAAAAGVAHGMLAPHPHGDFQAHWGAMASVLAQTTGGTATLADAAGFPLSALPGPLPLWHTGQGGEIARGYYGAVGLPALVRRFLGERPGRASVLSPAGCARVEREITAWAADLDAGGEDLGDLFYLHQRMARWAAPTHAAVEPVRDSTSPLWSARLLPELLGLPAPARAREEFHLRVLEVLAPELVDLPFEGGRPWPSRQSALARRAQRTRSLATKLRAEAARRTPRRPLGDRIRPTAGFDSPSMVDPFAAALAEIRALVLNDRDHAAWEVLDRARVTALLERPPETLDAMSRAYVWRLATVFAGFPAGPAAQ